MLTTKGWSIWGTSISGRCHDLPILTMRVSSVSDKRRVHGSLLILIILNSLIEVFRVDRFLLSCLSQHILHWSCLHVMKHSLFSDRLTTHRRWAHITQRLLCWEAIHFHESLGRWADQGRNRDLIWDWNKTQKVVLQHLI